MKEMINRRGINWIILCLSCNKSRNSWRGWRNRKRLKGCDGEADGDIFLLIVSIVCVVIYCYV